MGQIVVTLTITQSGSGFDGTVLDNMQVWIKSNITNNLPSGVTATIQPLMTLYPTINQQLTVTVQLTLANITLSGALINQLLSWVNTNVSSKLPSNYTVTVSISLTP